jgi:hypothetical protein
MIQSVADSIFQVKLENIALESSESKRVNAIIIGLRFQKKKPVRFKVMQNHFKKTLFEPEIECSIKNT